MRVWDKAVGTNTQFELIYERNFSSGYKIHRFMTPHNRVRAQICRDIYTEHPSQKPIQLIRLLISESGCTNTVLDPFCGSGTTLVAAKQLGRKAIGIEISEKYCQIAVDRLRQMELFTNKEGNK
jgi:DNA modification methylase